MADGGDERRNNGLCSEAVRPAVTTAPRISRALVVHDHPSEEADGGHVLARDSADGQFPGRVGVVLTRAHAWPADDGVSPAIVASRTRQGEALVPEGWALRPRRHAGETRRQRRFLARLCGRATGIGAVDEAVVVVVDAVRAVGRALITRGLAVTDSVAVHVETSPAEVGNAAVLLGTVPPEVDGAVATDLDTRVTVLVRSACAVTRTGCVVIHEGLSHEAEAIRERVTIRVIRAGGGFPLPVDAELEGGLVVDSVHTHIGVRADPVVAPVTILADAGFEARAIQAARTRVGRTIQAFVRIGARSVLSPVAVGADARLATTTVEAAVLGAHRAVDADVGVRAGPVFAPVTVNADTQLRAHVIEATAPDLAFAIGALWGHAALIYDVVAVVVDPIAQLRCSGVNVATGIIAIVPGETSGDDMDLDEDLARAHAVLRYVGVLTRLSRVRLCEDPITVQVMNHDLEDIRIDARGTRLRIVRAVVVRRIVAVGAGLIAETPDLEVRRLVRILPCTAGEVEDEGEERREHEAPGDEIVALIAHVSIS